MNNKYFLLFASCIPVKGYRRSVIQDLQRNEFYYIPNDLYNILVNHNNLTIEQLFNKYPEDRETIDEYFYFLTCNELGFYTDNPESFPKLDPYWDYPGQITNAIIEFNSSQDYNCLISDLESLGYSALEIRCFEDVSIKAIEEFLSNFDDKKLRHISLILENNINYSEEEITKICNKHLRINEVYIQALERNEPIKNDNAAIFYYKQSIKDCCGFISLKYMSVNMQFYTESQKHNTCLNRKVSISAKGQIKNCPYQKKNFGNISNKSIKDVTNMEEFKKHWFINKDNVDVCMDCEFRYMCTDCRVFVLDEKNSYSKPKYCRYNPYNAVWE